MKDTGQQKVSMEELAGMLFPSGTEDTNQEPEKTQDNDENIIIDIPGIQEDTNKDDYTPKETDTEENIIENSSLKNVVNNLIEAGYWDDYRIEVGENTYESLTDLAGSKDFNEEVFNEIYAKQREDRETKLKESSVDISKLDDSGAKLVQAIAQGFQGFTPFVDTYEQVIKPLKNLDLTNQANAEGLLYKYYKEVEKLEDGYIEYKINNYKKELNLEDEAEKIRGIYIDNYNSLIEQTKKQEEEQEREFTTAVNQAKKDFKEQLKSSEYDDPFISKAIPIIFEFEQGVPHWALEITNRLKEDTEFKTKLAHWLLDEEDYINKKFSNIKREEKLKTLNTISILGKAQGTKNRKEEEEDSNILPILGIEKK